MIKVSESAKTKVVTLMQEEGFNPAEAFVRVGVKSGGCSGLSMISILTPKKRKMTNLSKTMTCRSWSIKKACFT